jgi:hypothetical protein
VLITFLGSLLMLGGQPAYATTTTITYTDFSNLSGIVRSGSTAAIPNPAIGSGGQQVLRITNNLGQAGGAFLDQMVPLQDASQTFKASFSTAFDFQMTHPMGIADENGMGADGIVFVIQTTSNQYGGPGVGLGYSGLPKSVGIEFDTWDNGAMDHNSGNHVAVLANGSLNELAEANVPGGLMKNGNVWHAWIDYDGDTKNLEVRVTESATRPAAPLLSYTIDLPAVLQQSDAYVGFTGATGASGNYQDIRAWQFTNVYNPISNICSVPGDLTWLPPMSSNTPAPAAVSDMLPIKFQYNSCTADDSVAVLVTDAAWNVYTGVTLGGGIAFESNTGTYETDFRPADYGVAPGTQLTVWVYFGDALQGSAQINVQ